MTIMSNVPDDYSDVIEAVKVRYEERALGILTKIRQLLIADGWEVGEPYDLSDDVYRWNMSSQVDGKVTDDCVDFAVEIAEGQQYGDDDVHDGYGVNFGFQMVGWGGHIYGEIMPYNFTDQCWVDARDPVAVEERFKIVEDAEYTEVLSLMPERTQ